MIKLLNSIKLLFVPFLLSTTVSLAQTIESSLENQTINFDVISPKTAGDQDFTLDAAVSSGLKISYTSSNTDVATIEGGRVHVVGEGITIITASQSGNVFYNAAADVTQTLEVTAKKKFKLSTTGDIKDVSIYPNPVYRTLKVNMKEGVYDRFVIYNLNGKIIKKGIVEQGMKEMTIDFNDLAKGMYILKLSGSDSVRTFRSTKY